MSRSQQATSAYSSRSRHTHASTHDGHHGTRGEQALVTRANRSVAPADMNTRMRMPIIPPLNLDDIDKSVKTFSETIQAKMSACLFTRTEVAIKEELYNELKTIRDHVVTVFNTYHEVSNQLRYLRSLPTNPSYPRRVQELLEMAWGSIVVALRGLSASTTAIMNHGGKLSQEVASNDRLSFLHAMVRFKIPEGFVVSGFAFALASTSYNVGAAYQIEHHENPAIQIQTWLALSAVLFGTTAGSVISFFGREAPKHKPEPRDKTRKAMKDITLLLESFRTTVGSLDAYWRHTHYNNVYQQGRWLDPLNIAGLIVIFDKHVDDYGLIAAAFDSHLPNLGCSPVLTPAELYQARNGQVQRELSVFNYPPIGDETRGHTSGRIPGQDGTQGHSTNYAPGSSTRRGY